MNTGSKTLRDLGRINSMLWTIILLRTVCVCVCTYICVYVCTFKVLLCQFPVSFHGPNRDYRHMGKFIPHCSQYIQ